jgi:hypothetical protein
MLESSGANRVIVVLCQRKFGKADTNQNGAQFEPTPCLYITTTGESMTDSMTI